MMKSNSTISLLYLVLAIHCSHILAASNVPGASPGDEWIIIKREESVAQQPPHQEEPEYFRGSQAAAPTPQTPPTVPAQPDSRGWFTSIVFPWSPYGQVSDTSKRIDSTQTIARVEETKEGAELSGIDSPPKTPLPNPQSSPTPGVAVYDASIAESALAAASAELLGAASTTADIGASLSSSLSSQGEQSFSCEDSVSSDCDPNGKEEPQQPQQPEQIPSVMQLENAIAKTVWGIVFPWSPDVQESIPTKPTKTSKKTTTSSRPSPIPVSLAPPPPKVCTTSVEARHILGINFTKNGDGMFYIDLTPKQAMNTSSITEKKLVLIYQLENLKKNCVGSKTQQNKARIAIYKKWIKRIKTAFKLLDDKIYFQVKIANSGEEKLNGVYVYTLSCTIRMFGKNNTGPCYVKKDNQKLFFMWHKDGFVLGERSKVRGCDSNIFYTYIGETLHTGGKWIGEGRLPKPRIEACTYFENSK